MRRWMALALLGALAAPPLLTPTVALAEDAAEEEEAFDVELEPTGSAPLDQVFDRSKQPILTIAEVRTDVRAINPKLVGALGLSEGTPFRDALANLQEKAENKINVSFEANKWPSFTAAEGVPDTVKPALNQLNSSFADMRVAEEKLKKAAEQLTEAAAEATELAGEPKQLGLKATKIPKALTTSKKNVKALNSGVDVTKELLGELTTMLDDVRSVFTE